MPTVVVNLALPSSIGGALRPHATDFLNIERSISVSNDVDGWTFQVRGRVQPFEETEKYEAPRKADRFTTQMLERYCHALGIRLFDPAFYGGPGVVIDSPLWFLPRMSGISLLEAQRALGLPTRDGEP